MDKDVLKKDVCVMSVSRYQMVNRDTREVNEGTTVRYIFSTDLSPSDSEDLKGYKFGKSSLNYVDFEKFGQVPGVYSADLDMNVASDGTVKIKAKNFEFKKPLVVGIAAGK